MRERKEESNEGIARSSRHKETDKRYKKAHALKKISLQMGNKDIPTHKNLCKNNLYTFLQVKNQYHFVICTAVLFVCVFWLENETIALAEPVLIGDMGGHMHLVPWWRRIREDTWCWWWTSSKQIRSPIHYCHLTRLWCYRVLACKDGGV